MLAKDTTGRLRQLMEECVDGDYQDFKSKNGAYVREKFFGRYPETAAMVADWSDEKIWTLTRGGHDAVKVYAAYKAAVESQGKPTVILAKTVKGYGMGEAGEGQMITHQQKKMGVEALKQFRDRFKVPVADADLEKLPFIKLTPGSPEEAYFKQSRDRSADRCLSGGGRRMTDLIIPPLKRVRTASQVDRGAREFYDNGLCALFKYSLARQEYR